jgi:glycosidase
LHDDGYDIADYTSVNVTYGSLEDSSGFSFAGFDPAV